MASALMRRRLLLAAHGRLKEAGPRFEGLSLFIRKAVALVNPCNAAKTARGMIQNLFDHRQVDAQPRHSASTRPAQVVQTPLWDRFDLIGIVAPLGRGSFLQFQDFGIEAAFRAAE